MLRLPQLNVEVKRKDRRRETAPDESERFVYFDMVGRAILGLVRSRADAQALCVEIEAQDSSYGMMSGGTCGLCLGLV